MPEWAFGMSRSRPVDTAVGEVGETPTEIGEKVIRSKWVVDEVVGKAIWA